MPAERQRPKKFLRASRACDFCHKRSIRCRPGTADPGRCQNCYDFDVPCTYDRPLRRGRDADNYTSSGSTGPSAAVSVGNQHQSQPQNQNQSQHQRPNNRRLQAMNNDGNAVNEPVMAEVIASPSSRRRRVGFAASRGQMARAKEASEEEPSQAWKAFAAASVTSIEYLVDVYLQVVYPIFPLFHQPTLLQKVRDQDYLTDRGFFASLMAACALASARGRDGALYGPMKDASYIDTVPSETFYTAVQDTLSKDFIVARDFNYLRACALLAITSIQYGDIEAMQLYLGHYFTLAGIHRFHDESYWPKAITNIEIEERRRLYWSTYTLDIYASIVWNGSIHAHGANARVRYPTEVEDELITHFATLPSPQPTRSWLRGWNFTTDLYLTLEHASNILRARHPRMDDRIDIAAVFGTPASSSATVLGSITANFTALPTHFKMFAPLTGDRACDIFGFQAANIQATMLLLRMVFLCAEDDRRMPPDVRLKCNVAAELLAVFKTIPTAYLCGISTPLIYHLAGIGTILGSVMESPLSEIAYEQVRSMLLSISDLLESLESGLSRAADISKGLRTQVERIDQYMRDQRRSVRSADARAQQSRDAIVDAANEPASQQQQDSTHYGHTDVETVGAIFDADGAHTSGTTRTGAGGDGELLNEWLGEYQLPPELLEDWPWPFSLQSESWSFLGS